MFQKILVPLDGSELAERALEPALTLAQQVNGEVICLSVNYQNLSYEGSDLGYSLSLLDDKTLDARQKLVEYHDLIQRTRAHPNIKLRSLILEGDEAGIIVDTATAEEVDLIVMSTHGRTGLSRWLLGSVTERVLQSAPCPVLVIRRAEPISRLLITLDGSELAEMALAPGLVTARRLGSSVTLLGVESDEEFDKESFVTLEQAEKGLGEQVRANYYLRMNSYLQGVAARAQSSLGQEIKVVSRGAGPAANRILEYIDRNEIDLVVMATHGRTGLRRWVYGSVAQKVLRRADCAVLIVRPPAERLN